MQRGSVAAVYTVYQDFYHYKSGIYKHTAGNATGSHAVKIIGWGQDGDTPYWIIANSWGDWGEHGFFRMVRGINDCGIEESVTAVVVGNGQKNQ
ncbi:papain family cysteine protease [Ostertagia ostertagi]